MNTLRLTRRRLLEASLFGAAAATPLVRLLGSSVVRAQDPSLTNFICVYHPHGIAAEFWAMKPNESETSYDLKYENCSLAPFDDAATYGKSFKDKLLIIEGIDHLSNANGHDSAGTILTGSRIDGKKPQNASLDQVLAVEHGLGSSCPVTSVSLGVGNDANDSSTTLSFGAGGAALPKIIDPVQAFDLLFANFAVSDDPAARMAAERKRKLGQSILDFVKGEVNELTPRLGVSEKQKLDQHLTSLRELEKRLQGAGASGGGMCKGPTRPDAAAFPKLKQYNGGEPYFDAITDAQVDVLAHAVACGITRFGTLFMNDLSYMGNPLDLPPDNHANVAHTYNASPIGNNGRPGDGDPATWLPLAKFNRYSYTKIARLMQKLDELGALENTLIYAASDMGNPSLHSTQNVPTLLAGGAGGKFRMGRRMRMVADCNDNTPWCAPGEKNYVGTANNHLLVSIAQAFGVQMESFGGQIEMQHSTGPLDGLV